MARQLSIAAAALLVTLVGPQRARAEGFISPLIGFNFGGDANCPNVSGCDDKRMNFGVGLGGMNAVLGFEEELAYARDFFGTMPGFKSSVLTLMSNVMIVPKIGPVRPYVLGGVGLIKTHVELTTASLLSTDNNNFGWDVGGGVMVTIVPHVAIRGDIRYFHSFQDLGPIPLPLANMKLDFGRAAAALTFTF
ncbi:MAG TPA: outer membrane beta-barrel protein [Vicinamibacterales bacterium]|nr:outer membrane beta-barrel protein [Vicinamibacterales bacterium]